MPISNHVTKAANFAKVYKYKHAINKDIRQAMETEFPKAVAQFKNIGAILKGKDEKETAKLIWLFLKHHCQYRRDPTSNQIIRLPSYFLNHKPHQGDCKTFSTFARSAYASIYPELETAYKFTGYASPAYNPSHVYVVVKDKAGNEIIIDGCYNKFNAEKNFTLALPKKFKAMRITSLSGTTEPAQILEGINSHSTRERRERIKKLCRLRNQMNLARAEFDGGHITPVQFKQRIAAVENEISGIGRMSKADRKKKRKAFNEKVKKGWKKFGKGLAFGLALVNLAPVRGAFLSLVALNLNGLASNMQLLYKDKKDQTGWNNIKKFWKKVGGFDKILTKAMLAGTSHKPLWLSKKSKARYNLRVEKLRKEGKIDGLGYLEGGTILGEELQGIGIAPAVAAAALTMGASLLAGIIPIIMKALAGKKQPEAQEAQAVLQEQGQEIIKQTKAGQGYQKAFADDEGATKDQAEDQARQEEEKVEETQKEEGVEGIGAMSDASMTNLFSGLSTVMGQGLEFASNVIERKRKKNPKVKIQSDDYYAEKTTTNLGYPKRYPRSKASGTGVKKYLPYVGGALVLGLVAKKMKLF